MTSDTASQLYVLWNAGNVPGIRPICLPQAQRFASPCLSPPALLTGRLWRQIERGADIGLTPDLSVANQRHVHLRGTQCKAQSGSALNHRPPGYAIPYGELPNSKLRHTFDTSSRRGVTLAGAGVRTSWDRAAGVDSLVECGSRRLLSYLLDKCAAARRAET